MVSVSGVVLLVAILMTDSGNSPTGVSWAGQASLWIGGARDTLWRAQAGLRYVPQWNLRIAISEGLRADAEVSVNGFARARGRPHNKLEGDWRLQPYRAWARIAEEWIEARIGLQKISFGSATLLRPLMWFDRIDPCDPLQMTDGVYGLLCRYYFGEQGNIWTWGLLGNSETKGWEAFPSLRWFPELGGRIQASVPRGEIALSGHYRRFSFNAAIPEMPETGRELRFGLDGKWDVGIGLSFEVFAARQWGEPSGAMPFSWWQKAVTLGTDYTLALGNGVTVLGEHMMVNHTADAFESDGLYHITGSTLSYPFSLVDELRVLVLYDWSEKNWYRLLSWEQTLDNWTLNLAVFWNPDRIQPILPQNTGTLSGKGVQFMVVFNH